MVRMHGAAVLMLLLAVNTAYGVTPDELRALSTDSDQQQRARDARAKTNDLGALVPTPTPAVRSRSLDRYSTVSPDSGSGATTTPVGPRRSSNDATTVGDGVSDGHMVSDAVPIDVNRPYGIRIGTWMQGTISRNISSAEPGRVEIRLTSDVVGDKHTLHAGAQFFAQKQVNAATKRLEIAIQNGIAPDGHEFKMTGLIYDLQKVSGLTGIINIDNDSIVKRGTGKGLLAAAQGAARTMAGGNAVASAGSAGLDSVLQDESRIVDQSTEQKLTIYVAPQPVLIRVEETF